MGFKKDMRETFVRVSPCDHYRRWEEQEYPKLIHQPKGRTLTLRGMIAATILLVCLLGVAAMLLVSVLPAAPMGPYKTKASAASKADWDNLLNSRFVDMDAEERKGQ